MGAVPATPYGLGRRPLPPDPRDFPMRAVLEEAPRVETLDRRFWTMPRVIDQGATGTCEGQGWTHWLADGPVRHPTITALNDDVAARDYGFDLYVEATGDTSLQEGAYTRQLVRTLVSRGLVGAYHRAYNVDDLLDWLLYEGPVGHGSYWYYGMFATYNSRGETFREDRDGRDCWLRVDETTGIAGGHFYVLDGVDLDPDPSTGWPPFVRLHNSWGRGWGHGGVARLTLPDLEALFVGDAWACTEVAAA